ncbi:MAG TPA: carboxypeptidase-like regulatory domain-containing protein, partial [Vicinamibacterales bacterium]|nr:carboxypeptidase-like regulatory domain-containing protein [Vicinamibacterales bacterium]
VVGRVVDAATGQPVPEAEVTVAMRAPTPPVALTGGLPGGGPTNVRLLTGTDGRFMVRDLPAGNVQVSVKAPGYVNGSYGQTRPAGPSSPIAISPENKIVAASIRLWKHAVVSGMVTDERNEPAVNVQVRTMVRSYRQGQPRFSSGGFGRTDDRGMYRIAGLTPGDYIVLVPQTQTTMPVAAMDEMMQGVMGGQGLSAGLGAASLDLAVGLGAAGGGMGVRVGDQMVTSGSGTMPVLGGDGRMAAYVTQYHPAASTSAEATVFSLASGEERSGVDIRMPLVPTARVSGMVIGPEGPLSGAQVRLLNVTETADDLLSDVARSVTAANGSFQLFGVPAGQYTLKVVRQGRQPLPAAVANNPQLAAMMGGRGAAPVSASDALTLFAEMPLAVERDVTDLAITLSTGATVSGHVEFAGTAAVPPFTGINLSLSTGGGVTFPVRPANVGEDGRFVTGGLAAGKYFISVSGRTPGWFVKSAMVNGVDALDQPFELSTENIGNVVVTFTDRQSTVSGTVIDAASAPAQGTVIVFPASYREWIAKGMSPRLMRNVRTQAKGAFSIPGLPARDYLIVAVPDDQMPDVQNPNVFEALVRAATPLTLSEGDTRTVSIKLTQVVR